MEYSLEGRLHQAVINKDLEAVTVLLARGANPNKISGINGKTSLGAAACQSGSTDILRLLIDASDLGVKTDASSPPRKRLRLKKRRLERSSDELSGKIKIGENHNDSSPHGNYTRYLEREENGCRNRGYYVFIHEDGVVSDVSNEEGCTTPASSSTPSTPSTPSSLADLEWDEEVGNVAASTREDETWSSLYEWYAGILEGTGAALACAAAIPSSVDQQDAFMKTATHHAAEGGHVAELQILLDAGCKVNTTASDGMTPLHAAVMRGHCATARLLLSSGAHVDYPYRNKMTALHIASFRGYTELVEMLVQAGATVDARNGNEGTPLFLAAGQGHKDILNYLIAVGANVNIEGTYGDTPLSEAVWQNNVSAVKILLSAGARAMHCHNLLHVAVRQRQEGIVKLLAPTGGINRHDKNGDTPLLLATRTSQANIATILLNFGADVNACDSITGATAVHIAVERIDSDVELNELLIDLLDYGLNINALSLTGDTALNRAILLNRDNAAAVLVRHGADPNACNLQTCALDNLTLAGRRPSPGLARLLIKAGHALPSPAHSRVVPERGTAGYYIREACRNPLSLTDLCRLTIRSFAGAGATPLHRYLSRLPLPNRLISFLKLEDEGG